MSASAKEANEWLMVANDVPSDIDVACPGCKSDFSSKKEAARPCVLSCHHSICAHCVDRQQASSSSSSIDCPVCHAITLHTGALPTNDALVALLQSCVISGEPVENASAPIDFDLVLSAELLTLIGTHGPIRISLPADTTFEALEAYVASRLPPAALALKPHLRDTATHKLLKRTASMAFMICVGDADDLTANPPVIGRNTPWARFFHLYRKHFQTPEQRKADTRVTCKDNRLMFGSTGFSIDFQRTLRLPMGDGKVYPLPPGLGTFPIVPLDAYKDKVPAAWLERGGVIIPMQEAEAMWLNFQSSRTVALQVSTGGINSVSGEVDTCKLQKQPQQNYLVSPPQPWLDGINAGDGVVKQFVAVSLGSHKTIEAQVKSQIRQDQAAVAAAAAWFSTPPTPPKHMAEDESMGGIQFQVRPTWNQSFWVRVRANADASAVGPSPSFGYYDKMKTPAQLHMPVGTMLELTSDLLPTRKLTLADWLCPKQTILLEATHGVRLNIKTLIGTHIPIDTDSTDSIECIKAKIHAAAGIPTDQQRLIWAGQQLDDRLTIGDYNICSEATVHLVLRLRGGCFTADTLVSISDGKQKRIVDVQVGDQVLIYHLMDKQSQTRTVSRVHCYDVNEIATVRFSDGRMLRTTFGHAMRIKHKNGWAAVVPDATGVSKLEVGDVVCTSEDGHAVDVSVVSIEMEYLGKALPVYTLSIAPNAEDDKRFEHRASLEPSRVGDFDLPYVNFFANGILVHNGSNGVKIWVRVGLPNGEYLVVHTETDDSIGSLRAKIDPHLGPSARLYSLFYNGKELADQNASLMNAKIVQGCTLKVLIGSGIAAGAQIKQKIYEDTQPEGAWTNEADVCRVFVHLANADMWRQITERPMPPTPVSADAYARHRLPFFALWKDELACVAKSNALAGVLDLKQAILVTAPENPTRLSVTMASILEESSLVVPVIQQI
jgi:hypothetical protein